MRLINLNTGRSPGKASPSDTLKTDFLPEKAGVLLRENLKEILIDAWELTPIPLSSLLKNIFWGKRKDQFFPLPQPLNRMQCSLCDSSELWFLTSQKAQSSAPNALPYANLLVSPDSRPPNPKTCLPKDRS